MPNRRYSRSCPLGARAGETKDRLYALGGGRLLFTFASFCSERPLRRCSVQVLVTLEDLPFQVSVEGATGYYRAAALKPRVARTCRARHGINLQIDPSHEEFRRFRHVPSSGLLALPRDAFRALDADMERAYRGELDIDEASRLADAMLAATLAHLPPVGPLDPRVAHTIELLKHDPRCPLDALADAVGLSYYRLSHLFLDEMGISLRSFHLWRKVHAAMRLLGSASIAETARATGFTDGSHLTRAFQQLHAVAPSYFFDRDRVEIIARRPGRPARVPPELPADRVAT